MFLQYNSKSNRSRNMTLEYIVVYDNISEKFSIMGIVGSKPKSWFDFEIFLNYRNTNCQVL